jgi:hypothetical protein
MDTIYMDTST